MNRNHEDKFLAAMEKEQAEEAAIIANHCGADSVSVDCNKPAKVAPIRPSRKSMVSCIAFEYGVELAEADAWLEAAFNENLTRSKSA